MRMRASLCQNKWAPLVPAELRAMASGFLSFFRLLLSTPSPSSQTEMLQLLLQIRAWMVQRATAAGNPACSPRRTRLAPPHCAATGVAAGRTSSCAARAQRRRSAGKKVAGEEPRPSRTRQESWRSGDAQTARPDEGQSEGRPGRPGWQCGAWAGSATQRSAAQRSASTSSVGRRATRARRVV